MTLVDWGREGGMEEDKGRGTCREDGGEEGREE